MKTKVLNDKVNYKKNDEINSEIKFIKKKINCGVVFEKPFFCT